MALLASACAYHLGAFRHEVAHYLHGAFEQASAVAAQVEHDTFQRGVAHKVDNGFFDAARAALVESSQAYVADAVGAYAVVGQGIDLDVGACDVEAQHRVLDIGAAYVHAHLRAGLPSQAAAYGRDVGGSRHGVGINGYYHVAWAQSGLERGRAPLRL